MKNAGFHRVLAQFLVKLNQVRIETINSCNRKCSFYPMNVNSEETKLRDVVKMDNDLKNYIQIFVKAPIEKVIEYYIKGM